MAMIQNIIIEKFTKEESVNMAIKINSGSQEITANTINFGFLKVKPSKMPQPPPWPSLNLNFPVWKWDN